MNDIYKCKRQAFLACYFNANGYGSFKGEVIDIKENKYLFKRIYVEYWYGDGSGTDISKEDHVWIIDGKPFKDQNIKIGDKVSFSGEIKPYKRKDKSIELGITNPTYIEKIDDYELISDKEEYLNFISNIICESCLYLYKCNKITCLYH